MAVKPAWVRLRQGLVLLVGAVVFELLVGGEGPAKFYLVPLGLGLAYLAAATVGGRDGGFWATAVVLVPLGLAVLWVRRSRPDLDTTGVYAAALGVGALLGVALYRAGVEVSALGVAATILAFGLLLAFERHASDVIGDARAYAIALGVVGLFNVAGVGVARR